ncbi:type VI secretion system protein ImpH [Alteromonadaceae bacterium Bs31]|nr:type VI secretion system protein ImpH [Alteromonadaceae bacterium Bs31]
MSSESWRKNTSVIAKLKQHTGRFSFIQVVRLLERSIVFRNKDKQESSAENEHTVGQFSPPNKESIRLVGNPSLAFPIQEVEYIKESSTASEPTWQISANFLGLTGSMGILPYHYSELALQRLKKRDRSFINYLNIFNHRITSLFYQASRKYRLPLSYEQQHLDLQKASKPKSQVDNHTFALLSLIGLGSEGLQKRSSIADESLLFYGGLFCQQVRTAENLKQIIADYFSVPVNIEEFVGQWQDLIDDVRTRLPYEGMPLGQNANLGRNCMLGRKGWFAQGKVSISIGPLNQKQHQAFAPGSSNMKALNELVRLYLGMEHDYEFNILVKRKEISQRVSLSKEEPPIMGWSTWLSGDNASREQAGEQLLNITVSSN